MKKYTEKEIMWDIDKMCFESNNKLGEVLFLLRSINIVVILIFCCAFIGLWV